MERKFLSILLVVRMVFTMLPATVFAAECDTVNVGSVGRITAFDELGGNFERSVPFDGYTYALSVEKGTSVEDLNLPDELGVTMERTSTVTTPSEDDVRDSGGIMGEDTATPSESEEVTDTEEETSVSENAVASPSNADEGGTEEKTSTATTHETETISVSWQSNKDFNSDKDGNVIFTAELPEGYVLATGVELPQINVIVGIQGRAAITPPTAAEYAADAGSATDYTIDGTTLTIKTAKGAAFWSASGEAYLAYTVKLDADIDVSGFQWTPVGSIDEDGNLIPFSGTFDGQGHTISGMNFANNVQLAGLFGSVSGAVIENLTVSGSITVTEVASDWVEENPGFAAGIVGMASDTTITNCHSEVQITADIAASFAAAGIAAFAGDNVRIDGCSNGGAITVNGVNMTFAGGIVGDMELLTGSSSIKNCANTGALTADVTGGDGQIGLAYLGGIVGQKSGDENHEDINAVVENCYNSGTLSATSSGIANVGGIAGNNYGDSWERISNCYNVGTVTGAAGLAGFSAGIVGSNSTGSVYSSYWKTGTADTCVQYNGLIYNCGIFDTAGALAATTDENAGTGYPEHGLLYGSNLLTALNGWVEAQAAPGDYQTWIMKSGVNNGYPIFGAEMESVATPTFSPAGGTYSAAQNVTISCATTGADIYYTTNGTTPTTDSIKYTTPISVSATTTIQAIAAKSGMEDSGVATAAYTIQTGGSTHSDGDSYTPPVDNKPETVVTVPAEAPSSSDSKGNATMTVTQDKLNEILKTAQQIAAQQGVKENGIVAELTVNTPAATKSLTVNLPKVVQDTLVKERVVELKINSSAIEISFDKAAIGAIQSTAGMDAQITAKPAAVLSAEAKAAIGSRPVFDLTLTYGGRIMSSFGTGNVYVGIPYTLGKNEQTGNIAVVYVDEGGKVTWLTQSSYDATRKLAIFATDHFSTYGVAYKPGAPTFSDIDSHWAKDDILFVVNRGLFTGTGSGKFGPDLPITRGMFVTALGRLAQADVSSCKQSSFSDVSDDAYYMGYVEWANKNSIVNGIGGGKYAPDAIITREQMAVMIDRYATVIGFQLPAVHTENTFADGVRISSWAKDAVRRVQMSGIINGKTGNFFDPQGDATRAEVSAVLKRFIELAINSDTAQGWVMNDSGKWMYYENGKPIVSAAKTIDGISYSFDQNGEIADVPKNRQYALYTAQKGDSFWLIAHKYGCNMYELAGVNGKTIFSIIYAGEVLKVPEK